MKSPGGVFTQSRASAVASLTMRRHLDGVLGALGAGDVGQHDHLARSGLVVVARAVAAGLVGGEGVAAEHAALDHGPDLVRVGGR